MENNTNENRQSGNALRDKRTLYRFQWTWPVLVSAIICLAMVVMTLAAVVKAMKYENSLYIMITIGILLLCVIGALYYLSGIPLSLRVHKDCLVVSKFVYNMSIPWEAVISVEPVSGKHLKNSINENGVRRGLGFGYMGRQHTGDLGSFHMYATSLHNLVFIETDQKNYIISVPARDSFLEDVQRRMNEAAL